MRFHRSAANFSRNYQVHQQVVKASSDIMMCKRHICGMALGKDTLQDNSFCQRRDYSAKAKDEVPSLLEESWSSELMELELTTRRLLEGKAATYLYTRQIFNNTIDAWAKVASKLVTTNFDNAVHNQSASLNGRNKQACPIFAAGRASALLEFMERSSGIGSAEDSSTRTILLNKSLAPNSVSYNSTLHAWAKCGDARRAEEIFLRMQMQQGKVGVKPDIISYNTVLDAFAKQSARARDTADSINSAECAEKLVHKMEQSYRNNCNGAIRPNTCSYNSVIDAWANSGSAQSATKAQNVLMSMVKLHKSTGDVNVKPDVITLNSVVNAWSKSKVVDSAQRAESVLVFIERIYGNGNEAVRPNTKTFAAILNAWSKSNDGDAAYRAERILRRMETLYNCGNDVKPNVFAFTSVIDTFANNAKRDKNAASKAESILEWMINLSGDGQQNEISPNTVTFNAVIKAHAKSKQEGSAQRASNLLDRMRKFDSNGFGHMAPDTITFNAVINAWVNSSESNGFLKAQQTLKLMEDLFATGNVKVQPDTISYNAVLHGFSKCRERGSADKAKVLLHQMEKLHQQGNDRVRPNAKSFTSVINAYAKSSEPDQAVKAREVLERMNSLSKGNRVDMDIFVYTAVLNACAYTRGDDNAKSVALNIAITTMEEIQESPVVSANHVSYAMMLRACSRLCSDKRKRNKLLQKYFDDCCRDGYVNEFVLREMPNNLMPGKKNMKHIPPMWTRKLLINRDKPI